MLRRLLSGEVPYLLGYHSIWRRTEVSIPTAFLLPTVFWTGAGAVRHHPACLFWHRTEVSILVLLGQSQVCSHYTSPVARVTKSEPSGAGPIWMRKKEAADV